MRKVRNIAAACSVVVTVLAGASASADDALAPLAPPVEVDHSASFSSGGIVPTSGPGDQAGLDIIGADAPVSPRPAPKAAPSAGSSTAAARINANGTLTVTGRAKPGSTVTTTFPDGTTGSAVAGPDGSYQITSGGNVLKPAPAPAAPAFATPAPAAQPPANTANAASGAVAPQRRNPPPSAPAPTFAPSPSATDNGSSNPAASAPSDSGIAPDNGDVVPAPDNGATAAPATDTGSGAATSTPAPAGKKASQTGKAKRANTVPPTAAVKANDDGSITITGKTKPGSTITTTFPDGSTGTAKANDDGYYSITSVSGHKQAEAQVAPAVTEKASAEAKAEKPANPDDGSVVDASALAAEMSKSASKDSAKRLDAEIPAGPLTLDQAVLLAVSRHPSISSQIATISQAIGGIDVAKAGYYPQVTVGTSANTIYAIPGQFGNVSTSGKTVTNKTMTMQITQMIYDFGKVSETVDQARATVKREEANLLQQIAKIEQQTAEALINAHRYQVLVNIASQQVDAVQQVYQMAKLRASSGVSSRADPVQAETRLQSAQATMIAVKSLNDQTRQHLRTLVGGPVPGEIALPLADERVSSIKLDPTQDPDTSEMPGVLVAQANELIAGTQVEIAKAQMMPALTLNYTGNKAVSGYNTTTYSKGGFNQGVSFGLQWTAFQGGALAAQVKAAQHALEAARLTVASARLDGSDLARGYRDQALGAYSRLDKLAERRASIALTRDLYREQYKLGSRSILDLLNAEQEYYQATLDEEAAKHDYWLALVDYIGALGTGNTFYGIASKTVQGVKVQ